MGGNIITPTFKISFILDFCSCKHETYPQFQSGPPRQLAIAGGLRYVSLLEKIRGKKEGVRINNSPFSVIVLYFNGMVNTIRGKKVTVLTKMRILCQH